MTLAVGGTTLSNKFAAALQTVFLEVGDTEEPLSEYCDDLVTNTTDMGVEMSLPKVAPVEVPEVLPWAFVRDVESDPATDDEWAPVAAAAAARRPTVGFRNAVAIPGLLHITQLWRGLAHNHGSLLRFVRHGHDEGLHSHPAPAVMRSATGYVLRNPRRVAMPFYLEEVQGEGLPREVGNGRLCRRGLAGD